MMIFTASLGVGVVYFGLAVLFSANKSWDQVEKDILEDINNGPNRRN